MCAPPRWPMRELTVAATRPSISKSSTRLHKPAIPSSLDILTQALQVEAPKPDARIRPSSVAQPLLAVQQCKLRHCLSRASDSRGPNTRARDSQLPMTSQTPGETTATHAQRIGWAILILITLY